MFEQSWGSSTAEYPTLKGWHMMGFDTYDIKVFGREGYIPIYPPYLCIRFKLSRGGPDAPQNSKKLKIRVGDGQVLSLFKTGRV